jgi:hypothetical protein
MNEKINPFKTKLNEQLPLHTPDEGMWQHLSSKLDELDADAAFQERMGKLPMHSPDPGTWTSILFRLNRAAYYRTGIRITLSAAAGLLLFFTVYRFADIPHSNTSSKPELTQQEKPALSPVINEISKLTDPEFAINTVRNENPDVAVSDYSKDMNNNVNQVILKADAQSDLTFSDSEVFLNEDLPVTDKNILEASGESNLSSPTIISAENTNPPEATETSILFQKPNNAISTPPKYYTPKLPDQDKNGNYFALGMNYLPENINNGEENTVFHNLALTASYNKEKTRFNTSLGMAYNEDQFVFNMNYDLKTPVTAPGPNGTIDTLSFNIENMDSEYTGTEKHQYFTYNLGLGKRLFSLGKFSSWINAGAGFGIQVNKPDLIASTTTTIKGQTNAKINSVYTEKPEYTDYNINFITGIDFNYQIFNRLSISFAPTSRWYFKPLLVKDNQATDELSLGFTTGMKFDF